MRTRARRSAGFSVVEILVVLGIVIGVVSTVVIGLSAAAGRARAANTEFLMNSIANALTRFRSETGYLPLPLGDPALVGGSGTPRGPANGAPTIGWARDGLRFVSPAGGSWTAAERQRLQLAGSPTALPEFLVGYGDRSADGYGVIADNGALPSDTQTPGYREQPVLGIRDPGRDGLWGAFTAHRSGDGFGPFGRFRDRNLAPIGQNFLGTQGGNGPRDSAGQDTWSQDQRLAKFNPFLKGKSLGPYLEVKSDAEVGALLGFAADGTPQVALPGQVDGFDQYPKVLLDYFGNPIMYYRRGWLDNDPRNIDESWSLADIVALRPARFGPGEELAALPDLNGDGVASRAARAAEFALLSFGPDRRWNPQVRADAGGFNEDNLVRLGP